MGPVDNYNASAKHPTSTYNAALYRDSSTFCHQDAAPATNHNISVRNDNQGAPQVAHVVRSSRLLIPQHRQHRRCSISSSFSDLNVSIVSEMYNTSPNTTRNGSDDVNRGSYSNPKSSPQSISPCVGGMDVSSSGGEFGEGRNIGRSPSSRFTSTPDKSPMCNPRGNLRSTPNNSPNKSPGTSPVNSPRRSPGTSPMKSPVSSAVNSPRKSPCTSPLNSPRRSPLPSPVSPLRSPRTTHLKTSHSSPKNSPVKVLRPKPAQQIVAEVGVQEGNSETPVCDPIQTKRLKPIRQRTKNAVISIIDDGYVCLELIKNKEGLDRVVEVLKIAPDGEKVEVYQPFKGCVLQDQPPAPNTSTPTKIYPLHDLPTKYWKRYQYAARFVWLIRSKTPKVIMYTRLAKCMLMENSPNADCEVIFYDGSRYSYTRQGSRLHLSDGTMFVLEDAAAWLLLSPATRRACQYAQECHHRCVELESLLTPLDKRTTDVIYFPVMVGRRPSMFSITATSGSQGNSASGDAHMKTPTKEALNEIIDRTPCSSQNSSPEKTLCPSPSSARSYSSTTSLDNTMVNHFSTPHAARLARQGARRRSRSFDPSIQLDFSEAYNDIPIRQRHRSGSPSSHSRSALTQEARSIISDRATYPEMVSPVITSSPPQPQVMSSVHVPGIGRGTLLSNGEVMMEFSDQTTLSIQSSPSMVVRYRDHDGYTALYEETDQLPSDVKHKLEALPYVMSNLEAVQAKMPPRQMTP